MMRILASFLLPLLLALTPPPASAAADTAEKVLEALREERRRAGAEPLIRRADIDAVALIRARRIAALPHSERLALSDSIEAGLRKAGIRLFRNAALHLDMVRGYSDPAEGFLKSWRGYTRSWEKVSHPMHDSIGLASYTAADGWIILVVIMLDDLPVFEDLTTLESMTVERVNEVRAEYGLGPLTEMPSLTAVARGHSEEMARKGFFSHESPSGMKSRDRVEAAGLKFRALGENILQLRGPDDPAGEAVDLWMESPSHRKAILDPRYSKTGVGVAIDDDGMLFFTQLFFTPRKDR
jgi:uncharacterized protein YkwD